MVINLGIFRIALMFLFLIIIVVFAMFNLDQPIKTYVKALHNFEFVKERV